MGVRREVSEVGPQYGLSVVKYAVTVELEVGDDFALVRISIK